MTNNLAYFGILFVVFILFSTVYFTSVAFGVEKHSESAEEREHEENGNIQNGFSTFQPSNSSDSANNTQTKPSELSISNLITTGSPIIGNHSAPSPNYNCRIR